MILTSESMRAAEREAFAAGVSAGDLMEDAAAGIARFILRELPGPGIAQIFVGKGNNGGDALSVGSRLREAGWVVAASLAFPPEELSELARDRLETFKRAASVAFEPPPDSPRLVIDGLLGTGSRGEPRGPIRVAIERINKLREDEGCRVLAVDIPSGLGSLPAEPSCAVVADWTVALGAVKLELLDDRATRNVGRIVLVPLPALDPYLAARRCPGLEAASASRLRALVPRRAFDCHKGAAGKVAVVAGSPGMTGAAVLAGMGALRGGAGLVTLFVPDEAVATARTAAPAELMVSNLEEGLDALRGGKSFDAFAFGPGLGRFAAAALGAVAASPFPGVIDADGLNAVAGCAEGVLERVGTLVGSKSGPRLLTPHPGEFARLWPSGNGLSRRVAAERFAEANPGCTLLLKGARTVISEKTRGVSFNTSGQPGMATAGMGDLLSGLCAALLARGLSPYDAARCGAWLAGRAAEIARRDAHLDEALVAGDVLARLGAAFESLRAGWP